MKLKTKTCKLRHSNLDSFKRFTDASFSLRSKQTKMLINYCT